MSDNLTQEKVDEIFVEIKKEWDLLIAKSGQSASMAIALGCKGVSEFLCKYQEAKEVVESQGLVMPVLVEGLSVTIKESK